MYLLVYSLASLRRCKTLVTVSAVTHKRFVILIAAYREDAVILPTVHACLAQDYPCEKYDVVVVSDHMRTLFISVACAYRKNTYLCSAVGKLLLNNKKLRNKVFSKKG